MTQFTTSGLFLFFLCLSVGASGFRPLRPEVGGFLLHPVILFVVVALFFHTPRHVRRLNGGLVLAITCFGLAFAASSIQERVYFTSGVLKLSSILVTWLVVALLVKGEGDYRAGTLGLLLGVLVIAATALASGGVAEAEFNPMNRASGNKNAFSLYALPAVLLATDWALSPSARRSTRIFLIGATLVVVLTMLVSGNRSGWAGAVLIAAMSLFVNRRIRFSTLIAIGVVSLALAFLLRSGLDTTFQLRVEQTLSGDNQSDTLREALFKECFLIGLEHPVLGMGPDEICTELAKRMLRDFPTLGTEVDSLSPHNAITYLFGAGGLVLAITAIFMVRKAWVFDHVPKTRLLGPLQMMVALWVFRGLFTDEVLYAPAFSVGLGLCTGLAMRARSPAKVVVREEIRAPVVVIAR